MKPAEHKGRRVKTIAAVVAVAGVLLVVLAYRDAVAIQVHEAALREARESELTAEDREYFHYQLLSAHCSGLISIGSDEGGCGQSLSREEWDLRRRERHAREDEFEQVRAGNMALQNRLREMEEYEAQLEPRREAELARVKATAKNEAEQERLEEAQPDTGDATPSGAPTKRSTRTKSSSSRRQSKPSRTLAEDSFEDPITDWPFLID